MMDINLDTIEKLIVTLDKIGVTRDPDNVRWKWGGKVDFEYDDILKLAILHGGNNEDIQQHT